MPSRTAVVVQLMQLPLGSSLWQLDALCRVPGAAVHMAHRPCCRRPAPMEAHYLISQAWCGFALLTRSVLLLLPILPVCLKVIWSICGGWWAGADKSLAAYLAVAFPRPDRKCASPGCGDGFTHHLRTFLQGNQRVTLSVAQLPAGSELPGACAGKCSLCPHHCCRGIMAPATSLPRHASACMASMHIALRCTIFDDIK